MYFSISFTHRTTFTSRFHVRLSKKDDHKNDLFKIHVIYVTKNALSDEITLISCHDNFMP